MRIEWICTQCGMKKTTDANSGRPFSSGGCAKSPNRGPHNWVENRRIGK